MHWPDSAATARLPWRRLLGQDPAKKEPLCPHDISETRAVNKLSDETANLIQPARMLVSRPGSGPA